MNAAAPPRDAHKDELNERLGGRPIVLVGMMGAGKTTVGRRLATRLGRHFVDSDEEVEKAAGMTIEDIFATRGEADVGEAGAHMLEVCPSIATQRPSCEIHPLGIGGREDPVRLVFDAAPGQAVVIGLSDLGDRFRLVANEIEVVPPDEPLPNLPVARAVWKPAPSLSTSAESWLTAGGPHHTVLTQAVGAETLRDFAHMAHTELVVIDGATTTADFGDRLRWNQAYYRLAQGLPGWR
jgi:L-arabinose isomerase